MTETSIPAVDVPAAAPAKGQPYIARTRKQIQTAELAEQAAVRARWKALLASAISTWPKVPQEELLQVKGNLHRLAGMVQLRYHVNRVEADRQVKAFMDAAPAG